MGLGPSLNAVMEHQLVKGQISVSTPAFLLRIIPAGATFQRQNIGSETPIVAADLTDEHVAGHLPQHRIPMAARVKSPIRLGPTSSSPRVSTSVATVARSRS